MLSQLLPVAVQTVTVAFRLGLCVIRATNRIEPQSLEASPLIILGLTPGAVATELKDFSQTKVGTILNSMYRCADGSQNLPPASRPLIFAHIVNDTSVSGPPSVLKDFRKFHAFAEVRTIDIPIHVPGHASHLLTREDGNSILKTTSESPWAPFISHIPILSSVRGKLTPATNFRSLLEALLKNILMLPLR
jgi:noranthrone synthase